MNSLRLIRENLHEQSTVMNRHTNEADLKDPGMPELRAMQDKTRLGGGADGIANQDLKGKLMAR